MAKRIGGQEAQRNGDLFENLIMFFAKRSGYEFIKIPSGCKNLGKKLIPVKSPFDFILVSKSQTIFCDAKSTKEENFSYSMIDQDQVRNLALLDNGLNKCGYLINFNGLIGFVYVDALKLVKPRTSISHGQCLPMGTIKEFNFNALSSNGRTADFDSVNLGSIPSEATNTIEAREAFIEKMKQEILKLKWDLINA